MSYDSRVISRGEIYYIFSRNDTTGSEQRSGRPAVIVSNNFCNDSSPVLEVCYLTLKEKTKLPTHVFIDRGACENSTILCEQPTPVAIERIGDFMCRLPDDLMEAVDKALVVSLGLQYIIEQETKNPVPPAPVSIPAKEVIPQTTLDELAKLRVDKDALEEQNKKLCIECDSLEKRAEEAENLAREAATYKKLYDELLDRIMGRKT